MAVSKKSTNGQAKAKKANLAPATHEEDPLLSLSEVGRRLGKSHQTVSRWVKDGLLTAHRLPGGVRVVRESTVNRLLEGSEFPQKSVSKG